MFTRRLLWSAQSVSKSSTPMKMARTGLSSINPMLPFSATSSIRQYTAPAKEMDFLINDVYDMQQHWKGLEGQDEEMMNKEMVDMILSESGKFCSEVLSPLNYSADAEGCQHLGPHEVKTPTGFKEAYQQYVEMGYQGMAFPEKYGGQGLPYSLALFQTEMCATANWAWTMYPGLSKGAINTIMSHGSEELKEKYLTQLVTGEWTGTMCLTEPQCGSDLGQVTTKAEPIGDGKYKINGTKIFISCGEHDMTDNIIHCVLARLPGAPEGTKGISLFLVPKKKVNEDGTVSDEHNGVNIARIEDKCGCHGSSTCEILFEDAEGVLIGEENKGMNHMFTFINTSRMGVAVQGVAAAELSYQNALWYTKERRAMRSLTGVKDPDQAADPIIVHPDVRKNLLFQRAIAEGGRSMVYECAKLGDKLQEAEARGDTAEAKKIDSRLGFLTPILKGFLTEVGLEATNLGIQIYGGHGYIKSNKQEQVMRDVRIAAIWEGTTGIQALDLLGRKIMLQKMGPLNEHVSGVRSYALKVLQENIGNSSLRSHALSLLYKTFEWQYISARIGLNAGKNMDWVGSASVDYLMYSGYVSLAHHWLMAEEAAFKKMESDSDADKDFLDSKVKMSNFVFSNILPRTATLKETMLSGPSTVMDMKEHQFSFDHAL